MMHFLTWCDIVTSSAHTKENNNYFFKDSPFDVWKPRDSCICKTIKTSHFKPAKQNLRYQMNQERRKLMEARGVRAVQHNAICRCKQAWPKEKMLSLLCEVYWPQRELKGGLYLVAPPTSLAHVILFIIECLQPCLSIFRDESVMRSGLLVLTVLWSLAVDINDKWREIRSQYNVYAGPSWEV